MRPLTSLLVAAVVACNMAELGEVSREWERLTTPPKQNAETSGLILGTSSTATAASWAGSLGDPGPETPASIRARAASYATLAKQTEREAATLEHRQTIEARWRALVRACFPVKR